MRPSDMRLLLVCASLVVGHRLAAQTAVVPAPTLRAVSALHPIRLDGRLDEAAWQDADSIPNLTQVEPLEGAAASFRTVVKVLIQGGALIFGIRADDPDPGRIVSFTKARDAELNDEDHITLVLDTYLDGRTGYVFAVNPSGARYDALVSGQGDEGNRSWDAIWEAATARSASGWSAEIRIPTRSLLFGRGLDHWGLNVERRIQRLLETDRWASPARDFNVTQPSRAGRLTELPAFDLGIGLSLRPSITGGARTPGPGAATEGTVAPSFDATQRLGVNLIASATANTDFAETDVDSRRTNLSRFPLFFPEKRTFFLEGADIFEFGLGAAPGDGPASPTSVVPFFSRRIGLIAGEPVPIVVGGKLNGRTGGTNLGALIVRTDTADSVAPATTLAAARISRNVLGESSVGMVATAGDPLGRAGAWTAGADFTFRTSRLGADKNLLAGVWGVAMNRADAVGDRTAAGLRVAFPNDLWDASLDYMRIGDGFDPSLGFVPRRGVHSLSLNLEYRPRPGWRLVRQMFYELRVTGVTTLDGRWESYRVFTAPVNWQLESGDRFELNVAPQGERLAEAFEVADGIVIPPGAYHYIRYRLEGEFASKRPLSGQATWWFGGFYGGSLHQLELEASWKPTGLVTLEVNAERDIGRLPEGNFTTDVVGTRLQLNVSPDLQISSLVQYDNESRSLGSNTRLRWTFDPLGDLFIVYNHNIRDETTGWRLQSRELLLKLQYTFRP